MQKRYKTPILLILLVVFMLSASRSALSGPFDPSLKYRTIDTKHFSIHYPEKLEEVAQNIAVISEDVHDTLAPKFDWEPWGKTQMIVTDSSDMANGMSSVLPYNWMYIRVAAPEVDSSLNTFDEWLRMLILHEYTHTLHLDKDRRFWRPLKLILGKTVSPNGVVPGWFKEGMAIFEETVETKGGRGRASYVDMVIRTAILEDNFPTIDLAAGTHWRWPAGSTQYYYGGEFLMWLAEKYGDDKLYEFIDRVSSSPLLFTINRQARKTFSEEEFETEKIHNRYAKIKKPGAPRSKTFYDLWKEWKAYLEEKVAAEKSIITSEGLTPFETILRSKELLTSPTVSRDGQKIAFSEATPFGPPLLKEAALDGSNEKRLRKNVYATQISFSPDDSFIIYSKAGGYKRYSFVYDLYKYEFGKKKPVQLTFGKRARDPDISSDGKEAVCVTQEDGTAKLEILNLEDKSLYEISVGAPRFVQYSGPRFSPDGKMIAVSVNLPGKLWDIYIYDKNGKKVAQVTDDFSVDRDPVWSPDGNSIYYSADRTGVYNIYKYNIKTKKTERVTNVLTGVFRPALSPDGSTLFVQYYNGKGYDIRKTHLAGIDFPDIKEVETDWLKDTYKEKFKDGLGEEPFDYKKGVPYSLLPEKATFSEGSGQYVSKKYNAFGKSLLLPRFILPGGAVLDNAVLLTAMTGGADPMKWHSWIGSITYRTDANYLGYSFSYWYNRFRPFIGAGVVNYAADFGNLTFKYSDGTTRTVHLFEKRLRGYASIAIPVKRHLFQAGYFYEDRNSKTALTAGEKNALNLGAFAGFDFNYSYNDTETYQASISREGGRRIKVGFEVTNSIFGSAQKNEQYIFAGDWREYIGLWGRHVLALRAAGGMTWGDQLRQGTFAMGGSIGEGPLAGRGSLYYFPLRGLPVSAFSKTRATLLSAEYRFPLISVQRGLGTLPFFINDLHLGVFADYGNAWNANESPGKNFFGDFMLGTGVELRGDFVIGYGLPVTGRIGYGIIVRNRNRLGNLTDPLLGHSAKDGVMILQVGTSY